MQHCQLGLLAYGLKYNVSVLYFQNKGPRPHDGVSRFDLNNPLQTDNPKVSSEVLVKDQLTYNRKMVFVNMQNKVNHPKKWEPPVKRQRVKSPVKSRKFFLFQESNQIKNSFVDFHFYSCMVAGKCKI